MDQKQTPIFDAICSSCSEKIISFQTPGHTNGLGIPKMFKKIIGKHYLSCDVSVCDHVDSLSYPESFIKSGEKLLADAYKSLASFYIVNGSTTGNLAMVLSACHEGDKILLPRNAHKSVINSIIFAKIDPIWIPNYINNNLGIAYNLFPDQIETAIKDHPEAKAILISSPTYSGLTCDIKSVSKIARKYGVLLLVDEAWGAHFNFCKSLPESSVQYSDICIHSFHKMLPVMNQGAVLHINSEKIKVDHVKRILSMLQTTSPSYPLLANMDLVRSHYYLNGDKIFLDLIKLSNYLKSQIRDINYFSCLQENEIPNFFKIDPLKVTIKIVHPFVSGYDIERQLRKEYKIQIEASSIDHILILIKPGNTKMHVDALIKALRHISLGIDKTKRIRINSKIPFPSYTNKIEMPPYKAFFSKNQKVCLDKSVEKICGSIVYAYPPGSPILLPGERISPQIISYIKAVTNMGTNIYGLCEQNTKIKVINDVERI